MEHIIKKVLAIHDGYYNYFDPSHQFERDDLRHTLDNKIDRKTVNTLKLLELPPSIWEAEESKQKDLDI